MPPPAAAFEPVPAGALPGFREDDLAEAFAVFRRSAERILAAAPQQRPARPPPEGLVAASRAALAGADPAAFFETWFAPFRLSARGFVTAYYQPEVEARRAPEPGFETPVLARPADLVTLNETPLAGPAGETLTSARRRADGLLEPYPDRRAIEEAAPSASLAYVRDPVELFLIQVQGSASLRFPDGSTAHLTYDGRNGWPYASVGRLLIARGAVAAEAMSLETLKATLRGLGQKPGEMGRQLMQENRSYVFFRIDDCDERRLGPIGGQGCALTPMRSIAVDRSLWAYGLPFFISARLPWRHEEETGFNRLMIAQDTGSAILGVARADLYFGVGAAAGRRAGRVRHAADFVVFLPKGAGALAP